MTDSMHEHYRELVALSAAGELSSLEYEELQGHLVSCDACRREQSELVELFRQRLPLLQTADAASGEAVLPRKFLKGGYERRFEAKAQAIGLLPTSDQISIPGLWAGVRSHLFVPSVWAAAGVLVLVGLLSILSNRRRAEQDVERMQSAEIQSLHNDNLSLRQQNAQLRNKPDLSIQLSQAQVENKTLLARYNALALQLEETKASLEGLKTEASSAHDEESQTHRKLQQAENSVWSLTVQLESASLQLQLATSTNGHEQQTHMLSLEQQLSATNESLDQTKRLLAADRDIRNLMSARNLHITDVYDINEKGKANRAFGRVFYTEGKSLVFYAFDLGDRKTNPAKNSYQVWGWQEAEERSSKQTAQSLGILYVDDKVDNRWTLKVNDPEVLAQIDAVFVTAEPLGGSQKPTGKKLLYAYLLSNPNHP
jgi:anti-sigma-K factor RskA/putative zinc finger protein